MKIITLFRFLSDRLNNVSITIKHEGLRNSMNHTLGMQSEIFPIMNLGANCEGKTENNPVSQKTQKTTVLGACQVVSLYSLNSLDGFKSASKEIKDLELDVTGFDARQRKFHNPLLMQYIVLATMSIRKDEWQQLILITPLNMRGNPPYSDLRN